MSMSGHMLYHSIMILSLVKIEVVLYNNQLLPGFLLKEIEMTDITPKRGNPIWITKQAIDENSLLYKIVPGKQGNYHSPLEIVVYSTAKFTKSPIKIDSNKFGRWHGISLPNVDIKPEICFDDDKEKDYRIWERMTIHIDGYEADRYLTGMVNSSAIFMGTAENFKENMKPLGGIIKDFIAMIVKERDW